MTEVETIRAEVAALFARRRRGELDQRRFERESTDKTLALYRAVVRTRLAPDEPIDREHHVVHAHLKLSQSLLREPEQQAVSMFLTPTRLLRLRSEVVPARAATCDERDHTIIDEVPLSRLSRIRVERQVRWGEAAAGLLICTVALLGRAWLAITAPLLVLVGAAGIVHALAMPTRRAVVEIRPPNPGDDVCIHAVGRKSGRALIRALRAKLQAAVGE